MLTQAFKSSVSNLDDFTKSQKKEKKSGTDKLLFNSCLKPPYENVFPLLFFKFFYKLYKEV